MQLSDDELKVTLSNASGWNNVRCVCPLSPSYNYVEFKAENGPNMMIGIVDGDCGRNAYAGQFSNGCVVPLHKATIEWCGCRQLMTVFSPLQ
jgi:hypothetical protein